jgi:hypothetical protein
MITIQNRTYYLSIIHKITKKSIRRLCLSALFLVEIPTLEILTDRGTQGGLIPIRLIVVISPVRVPTIALE